jgi:SAM-dependent methyltransferase
VLKIHPVLEELDRTDFFSSRDHLRVLDIGTGVGTAPIGLWMWLAQHAGMEQMRLNVLATDASPDVCEEAARTVQTFRKHIDTILQEFETKPLPLKSIHNADIGSFDLITAQNVLIEEPDYASVITLAQTMLKEKGALIMIEPASRFGSRTLLQCRDELVKAGMTIYAPCVRQAECPALKRDVDWCHAISRWERPRFIRILDEQIGNLRLSLKYSYIIAMKQPVTIASTLPDVPPNSLFRIVSDRMDEKGRKKVYGCGEQGRLFFEKQKRDTTEANADFDEAHRYDLMTLEGFAPKANLMRMNPDSVVKLVKKFRG